MEVYLKEITVMRMYKLLRGQLDRLGYDVGSEMLNFLMDKDKEYFILRGYFGRGFKLVKESIDELGDKGESYYKIKYEIYSENETRYSFVWILNRNKELSGYKINNKN